MKLSSLQKLSLDQSVTTAETELWNSPTALTYLTEQRGLNEAAIRNARLGLVPTGANGPDAAYAGRIVVPYRTKSGVVAAKYRCIADHSCKERGHGKYMGLPGIEAPIYNSLDLFTPSYIISICEGEFDARVMSDMVGVPAVGVPGVNGWRPYHPPLFNGQFSQVIIWADGDEAGRDFALRLVTGSKSNDRRKRVAPLEAALIVHLDDGEDVTSTYLKEGPSGLRKRAGLED